VSSVVSIIALVVYIGLFVFFLLMWGRFILDLVRMLARQWRPRGIVLVLAETVYAVTDPPVKLVRRIVPPLRVGGAALDFAWSIVMLLVIILMSVALGFVN
jgi:YggT family protein